MCWQLVGYVWAPFPYVLKAYIICPLSALKILFWQVQYLDQIVMKTAIESILTSKGVMDKIVWLRKEYFFVQASVVGPALSLQDPKGLRPENIPQGDYRKVSPYITHWNTEHTDRSHMGVCSKTLWQIDSPLSRSQSPPPDTHFNLSILSSWLSASHSMSGMALRPWKVSMNLVGKVSISFINNSFKVWLPRHRAPTSQGSQFRDIQGGDSILRVWLASYWSRT